MINMLNSVFMLFTYIVFPKHVLFFINQRDIEFEFVIQISFQFRENESYFFDGNYRTERDSLPIQKQQACFFSWWIAS